MQKLGSWLCPTGQWNGPSLVTGSPGLQSGEQQSCTSGTTVVCLCGSLFWASRLLPRVRSNVFHSEMSKPPTTGMYSSGAEGKCNYICDQFAQLGAQPPDRNIYLRFESPGSWRPIQEVRSSKHSLSMLASLSLENKAQQQKTSTSAFMS